MRWKQPVVRAVFCAANGNVEQTVRIEVLGVDLSPGHRREHLELVASQTAVISVARQPAAYDAVIIYRSNELLFKRIDQILRAAHPLDPTVRLNRHQSSVTVMFILDGSASFILRFDSSALWPEPNALQQLCKARIR